MRWPKKAYYLPLLFGILFLGAYYLLNEERWTSEVFPYLHADSRVENLLRGVALNLVIICFYVFERQRQKHLISRNDLEHFGSGLLTTGVFLVGISAVFTTFLFFGNEHPLLSLVFMHLDLGLLTYFMLSLYIKWENWQRLLAKPNWVQRSFKGFLFFEMLLHLIDIDFYTENSTRVFFYLMASLGCLWAFVLVFRSRWDMVLNISSKNKQLPYFFLTVAGMLVLVVSMFIWRMYSMQNERAYTHDLFYISLLTFVLIYCILAAFTIYSSKSSRRLYDEKINELKRLASIDFSLREGKEKHEIYHTLLADIKVLNLADGAFLYFSAEESCQHEDFDQSICDFLIKKLISEGFVFDQTQTLLLNKMHFAQGKVLFYSALLMPIFTDAAGKTESVLVLLKKEKNAFEEVLFQVVNNLANATRQALNNYELLLSRMRDERIKQDFLTAHSVQQGLLPKLAEQSSFPFFDMSAIVCPAEEVGGDFYDFYQPEEGKFALTIGDVSGKGIVAATTLAIVKGIFAALSSLDLPPDDFYFYANSAARKSFPKGTFLTSSYFLIDTHKQTVFHARAGHCPALYYSASEEKLSFLEPDGVGLSLCESDLFREKMKLDFFKYQRGDLLVLYTDGVVEVRNQKGEEYGYERLMEFFSRNHFNKLPIIKQHLVEQILDFSKNDKINDDYSLVILRFK